MYAIQKDFTFDAAHRLAHGYEGKCANIHGHTFKVTVTQTSDALNSYGFVRDFADLKPVKEWLDQFWDHAFLVSQHDEAMVSFLKAHFPHLKRYEMDANPTSENLARILYETCLGKLGIPLSQVTVMETCTAGATYFGVK